MSSQTITPGMIVATTSLGYASVYLGARRFYKAIDSRTCLKTISGFHALSTTAAVLYVLRQPWQIHAVDGGRLSIKVQQDFLDDRENPMIHGHSSLGNAVTGWETGYLIYDTIVLSTFARKDSVMLAHHAILLMALGYLQVYIHRQQERGIWIILAFLSMNATTPLLHLRWWRRKRTGKNDPRIDIAFAIVFALCRFGTLYHVFQKYGNFHGISALQAFSSQRAVCKAGTTLLSVLNGAWWLQLAASIIRRSQRLQQ